MGTVTGALAALGEVSSLVKELWGYYRGGQTQAQNQAQAEADKWVQEFKAALNSGDVEHAGAALDQLRMLRDKAVARKSG